MAWATCKARTTALTSCTRKMLALGEAAKKKNLKVGVGLMCRHCEVRGELFKRIKNGEIGDLTEEAETQSFE